MLKTRNYTLSRFISWLQMPITRRIVWILFAVLFYYSGLSFTTLLLEPQQFQGGIYWLLVVIFPILVPLFFVVGRYAGCASGACDPQKQMKNPQSEQKDRDLFTGNMPGI
ncbi:MAG TPA: hypothetical protein ENI73_01805 [Spirochaetes bacterium]|nr:hypothetical protein [Spirochaetota bacterium]